MLFNRTPSIQSLETFCRWLLVLVMNFGAPSSLQLSQVRPDLRSRVNGLTDVPEPRPLHKAFATKPRGGFTHQLLEGAHTTSCGINNSNTDTCSGSQATDFSHELETCCLCPPQWPACPEDLLGPRNSHQIIQIQWLWIRKEGMKVSFKISFKSIVIYL